MSKAPYYTTGDAQTNGYREVVVSIPNSQQNWVLNVFLGALQFMAKPEAWVTGGESTQEDAAAIYEKIAESVKWMPIYAGSIMWSAAPSLPSYAPYLLCDGSMYLGTDYPALYAAISTIYNTGGEPAGYFRVPDLQGRIQAGVDPGNENLPDAWATALGGVGGDAYHTLIASEVPSHSHVDSGHTHGYAPALPNATTIGPGAPQPTAVPGASITGSGSASLDSFGGGGEHINTQPTIVMYAYVYAQA